MEALLSTDSCPKCLQCGQTWLICIHGSGLAVSIGLFIAIPRHISQPPTQNHVLWLSLVVLSVESFAKPHLIWMPGGFEHSLLCEIHVHYFQCKPSAFLGCFASDIFTILEMSRPFRNVRIECYGFKSKGNSDIQTPFKQSSRHRKKNRLKKHRRCLVNILWNILNFDCLVRHI